MFDLDPFAGQELQVRLRRQRPALVIGCRYRDRCCLTFAVDEAIGSGAGDNTASRRNELRAAVNTAARGIGYLRFETILKVPNVFPTVCRNIEVNL